MSEQATAEKSDTAEQEHSLPNGTVAVRLFPESQTFHKAVSWACHHPWTYFGIFLALYSMIVLIFSRSTLVGDESRYLYFAQNLVNGFCSPPSPDINLWNGPGYPMLLAPFVALGASLPVMRLINAILLYATLVFVYKTAVLLSGRSKPALVGATVLACYFPLYHFLLFILTEILSVFLVSLFAYSLVSCLLARGKYITPTLAVASVALAGLMLTKVIFAYVWTGLTIVTGAAALFKKYRQKVSVRKLQITLGLAILFCLPYLGYTYSLTGKIFYWSTSGGSSLYAMSTPFSGEYGDWFNIRGFDDKPQRANNHSDLLKAIPIDDQVTADAMLKELAIRNIKKHPLKYAQNVFYNVGRMLFSYPYSYQEQYPYTYRTMLPNMFIFVAMVIGGFLSFRQRKKLPFALGVLLLFAGMYLGGSALVSTYGRMFSIILPVYFIWQVYLLSQFRLVSLPTPETIEA